jgi:hypothetical protein
LKADDISFPDFQRDLARQFVLHAIAKKNVPPQLSRPASRQTEGFEPATV